MPKCPNCNHKHDFWDVELMELTFQFTEKFIEITGCNHREENANGYDILKNTKMYGCPKCHLVFWAENW